MTSLPGLTRATATATLSAVVEAIAYRTGTWVAVERFGEVLAHGRGSTPCLPALASAIVGKNISPLRDAVMWKRGRRPLTGTVDGVPVTAADLGPGTAAWFIDGCMEPSSLPALSAAATLEEAPTVDLAFDALLHPRGPARRGSASAALLVAVLAPAPITDLARRAAAAFVTDGGRVHVDGDVVLVALPHEADPSVAVQQLRGTYPSAVGGAAPVPDDASDWAATFRLARGLARAARNVGVSVGRVDNPAVLADLVLQEAQSAATDLLRDLVDAPLRKLASYDRRTSGQLVPSLAAWCDNGLDVAAAAVSMNVHHNTLRYRLKRAGEISGVDLAQPRQILALQVLLTS